MPTDPATTDPGAPELGRLIDALGPVPDALLPPILAALADVTRVIVRLEDTARRLTTERESLHESIRKADAKLDATERERDATRAVLREIRDDHPGHTTIPPWAKAVARRALGEDA